MANSAIAQPQPNIVLVLTDDQPYGYLGVTGNKIAKTPNIDNLANQGLLFTNAHVTSAICTPSRVSILLSQYERKHGVNFNSGTAVAEKAWLQSYPVLLRQSGYHTGWVGKNHVPVGEDGYATGIMEKSFDYWYASHGHMRFYSKDTHPIFKEAENDTQLEIVSEGIADFMDTNEYRFKRAQTFLDARPKNQPFMLSINLNLPHGAGAREMAQRDKDDDIYKSLYRDKNIPLPKHYVAKKDIKQPKLPADLLRAKDRQVGYNYVDTEEDVTEMLIRQNQAMTGIDRLVGRLQDELKRHKVDDNTIIILTSDHGLFMGEFGLGGKALCYEKTTHVPLIIYDPRQTAKQQTSDALVQSIDVAPTILSYAGVTAPKSYQGEDLSGFYTHQTKTQREYVFTENLWSTHFGNPRCDAIQDNQWKYIRYYANHNLSANDKVKIAKQMGMKPSKVLYGYHDAAITQYRQFVEGPLQGESAVYEELYHIAQDPDELNNLVNSSQHQDKLAEMRNAWLPVIQQARGSGFPHVVRYTVDSQLEKRSKGKAKTY
ncbi:acetylglucosamine-6-sulfatase [Saccharobesus litoralis]|uniref:Acetylglucosamine-6-sulfatase n=2 Tax=Saccharobesus litoralis TaxID=2172099 RepID=A0A2S0VTJ0_9ALTE|nr:acetylglucosamine-6-sulfatase [Saccharobesus litoralis]